MLLSLVEDAARAAGCELKPLADLVLDAIASAARATWPTARGRFEASWDRRGVVELKLYRTLGEDLDLDEARRCGLDDPADPLQPGEELGLTVFWRAEDANARELQRARNGSILDLEQPCEGFGRRAAAAAGRALQEATRARSIGVARTAFTELVGRIVVGRARRHERGALVVDLGGVEARLGAGAGGAGFGAGDRVLALVEAVRGRDVVLTRRGDAFVRALVALEVPAVERGEIEVVAVAAEAKRAKIAVRVVGDVSGDASSEAVGAVVGPRGAQVIELAAALGDVQLDVVAWHPDPVRAAIEALSGVEVVDVDVKDGEIEVRVAPEEVRAAVGARGSNARLAARIGGWRELRVLSLDA